MAESMLDTFRDSATPGIATAAARELNEPEDRVSDGLRAALTAILAEVAARADRPGALVAIHEIAGAAGGDAAADDQAGGVLAPAQVTERIGARLLAELFGARTPELAQVVAEASGLPPATAAALVDRAAPLAAAALGRRVRAESLDEAALGRALLVERDDILRAAPPGTPRLVGLPDPGAPGRPSLPLLITDSPKARRERRWLWPALAALLVGGVIAAMVRTSTPDLPVEAVASLYGVPNRTESGPLPDVGPDVRRELPGGREIDVPERGMEQRLIAFAEGGPGGPDTAWLPLDRLTYEQGAAVPTIESRDQLRDIAAVLAAYPGMSVRIAGTPADSGVDRRLVQMRVDSLRAWLVDLGVAPRRVTAAADGAPAGTDTTAPAGLAIRVARR